MTQSIAKSKEGKATKSSLVTAGPNNQDLIVNTCDVNLKAEAQLSVLSTVPWKHIWHTQKHKSDPTQFSAKVNDG